MTSWSFYIYSSCIVDAGKISERVSQSSHSEWSEKHSISSPGLWNLKHAPCQSGPEDVPGLPTVWAGSPQLLADRDWHCDHSYWYADLQGSACTFNQFLHTLSTCQQVNFKQFSGVWSMHANFQLLFTAISYHYPPQSYTTYLTSRTPHVYIDMQSFISGHFYFHQHKLTKVISLG